MIGRLRYILHSEICVEIMALSKSTKRKILASDQKNGIISVPGQRPDVLDQNITYYCFLLSEFTKSVLAIRPGECSSPQI